MSPADRTHCARCTAAFAEVAELQAELAKVRADADRLDRALADEIEAVGAAQVYAAQWRGKFDAEVAESAELVQQVVDLRAELAKSAAIVRAAREWRLAKRVQRNAIDAAVADQMLLAAVEAAK